MNKYIGKVCPYCKAEFVAGDDIVVCSDCEMPHHKECWIDNKGCTTFGCQGTIQGLIIETNTGISSAPKYDIRYTGPASASEQSYFCSKCGTAIEAGSAFCVKCGAQINSSGYSPIGNTSTLISDVKSKLTSDIQTVMDDFKTDDYLDPNIRYFLETNQEYYLLAFSEMKNNKKYVSWNWFSFLFSPFWCMYRKMYIPAGVILCIDFVAAILGGGPSIIISLLISLALGLFANYFYMYNIERLIKIGKTLPVSEQTQFVKKYGGTNIIFPLVFGVIYVVICIIIIT